MKGVIDYPIFFLGKKHETHGGFFTQLVTLTCKRLVQPVE